MEPDRRRLVIFAREPRLGVGKRRLAREVGDLAAVRFQRLMLARLASELGRDRRWRTYVAATPDRPLGWAKRFGAVAPQGPGDLGQRLARVIRRLPPGPVVVIGSDAPEVRRHDIAAAFGRLGSHDAVFGPAADGGYWLIGLRRRPQVLPFAGVRWSSAFALTDTVANLRARRVAYLRTLEDVDDAASLGRLALSLRPFARPPGQMRCTAYAGTS